MFRNNRIVISVGFVLLTMFITFFSGTPDPTKARQVNPPNIIIIFCDDLGYGDLSMYGSTMYNTPNLDKLASQGMRFTEFYAAQAVCSASRAGLLTGCYPNRIGISGALDHNSKIGLSKNEKTIAEIVKEKGYATAIFGKWHLGHYKEFLPLQHGFDEFLGLPYSNDMWPMQYDGTPYHDTITYRSKYPPLPLIRNNEIQDTIRNLADQSKLTTLYTENAVSFISRHKNKPFFLYLPHSMPHVPLAVSSKFKGKSKQGLYGDVVMEIDWSVGEIMKELKKDGLEDNTLFIFTSDNGPWLNFGNHAGSSGGLREGKGTSFEGGQKEPCIMRWPQVIPEGAVCNKMASTIDLLPTIAYIVNGQLPEHKIDGVNIISLMKNENDANPRDVFYYYCRRNNLEAVRKGPWKLIFPHEGRSYENQQPGNDGYPGLAPENIHFEMSLYDLRRDPGERYDVQKTYPEVMKELIALGEEAREDMGDDIQQRKGKNVRSSGRVNQ